MAIQCVMRQRLNTRSDIPGFSIVQRGALAQRSINKRILQKFKAR